MRLELLIGNKNYSSWSMRPWVAMRQAGIAFAERQYKFNSERWEKDVPRLSPTGKVPLLLVDGHPVWDSLAICETVAEMFPEKRLWPAEARARAVARAICAEMHSGFNALRAAMPMNIRGSRPGKGMTPDAAENIRRVLALWTECRERHGAGGEMLFGHFTIADAYYAPVVTRFTTYAVPLDGAAARYVAAVQVLAAVREWSAAARAEPEFVAEDEPYADAGGRV